MIKSLKYISVIVLAAILFSCKKDNYDPPSITLTGRLMYQSDSIQLERNSVHLQIYQYGFGRVGPVDQTFAQDGSYSALLFAGDYKLVIPNGDGPFMWSQKVPGVPDSVAVTLNGNQTIDLNVTPYYMVRNTQITAVGTDSLTATCKAEQIVTDANAKSIEYVALYVNKTQFVAGTTNIASASVAAADITDVNNIRLGVKIPPMIPTQNYVFARIGLKMANVEDLIFSPLLKINL